VGARCQKGATKNREEGERNFQTPMRAWKKGPLGMTLTVTREKGIKGHA